MAALPTHVRSALTCLLLALGPPAAFAQANCITFEGRHGGVSGEIVLDLDESEVRIGTGWWASITRRGVSGEERHLVLQPGDRFREPFDPRQQCDARRRYRFHLEHDGRTFTYEHPSATGFTQERVVDLGALSRFFGIPAAPDAEPGPVTVGDLELEGEWVRTESTYDPNDGMRILVEGDRATIMSRPTTANAAFTEGSVIWRDIERNGDLRVMGSNRNYYPGELSSDGPGRISLQIQHGGAGSAQTWVRGGPVAGAGCQWNGPGAAADIWVRFSTDLPAGLQSALRAARDAGAAIQTAALTPSDEWVVVAANQPCYSAGFPNGVREPIDELIGAGEGIDVIALGADGRWIVIAGSELRHGGVTPEVLNAVRVQQNQGRRISAFAFTGNPLGAVVVANGEATAVGPMAAEFVEAANSTRPGGRAIHDVAFDADGGWAVVAGDWFATRGSPVDLFQELHRYRTDENRRIDRLVLDARRGDNRWVIVSNRAEPAPVSDADRLERELGLDDESIWARMQAHDIRALAIAVVENNRVAWARGYGFRGSTVSGTGAPNFERYVYPSTVFDAASISKPVAAVGALQLVEDGELDLTRGGILVDLVGGVVPVHNVPALLALDPENEVTLARLLSHCAGLDHADGISSAQEVEPDEEQPSLNQMIFGLGPAERDNRIVRIDSIEVGESYDYSGANTLLVQALIEAHVAGDASRAESGFETHMRRLLQSLDMTSSTFETPRPDLSNYALGRHTSCGAAATCSVKAYPNQAAAALTTTVADLARFIIMLNRGGTYEGNHILDPATVDRMLRRDASRGLSLVRRQCDDPGTSGLGLEIQNPTDPETLEYWHTGSHNGFRTGITGFPGKDAGFVVLMTGTRTDGERLRREIRRRFRELFL